MNASVAIQTLPEAANDEELIRIVDEVIDYIKSTGLNYYVGPFETAIEGDYDSCDSGDMADCQRDRDGFKISASVAGGCGQGICK